MHSLREKVFRAQKKEDGNVRVRREPQEVEVPRRRTRAPGLERREEPPEVEVPRRRTRAPGLEQREEPPEVEVPRRRTRAPPLERREEPQEVELPIRKEKSRDSSPLQKLGGLEEPDEVVVPFREEDEPKCSCWFRTLGWDIGQELLGVKKLLPPPPGGERQRIAPSADTVNAHLKDLYQPLKPWQTRIITILPGRGNELLQCTLWTADMIDKPGVAVSGTSDIVTYDALSYAWSTGTGARYIHVNQLEVSVNLNLVAALADLRHERVQRNIWCDAICINQSDLLEKGQQVRNMLRVFEKAEHVIAWIGSPALWTRSLFRALTDDGNASPDPTLRPSGAVVARWRHNRECLLYVSEIARAASEHLQRPWFRRTWVRQEVFGTSKLAIYCGGNFIGLPEFITATRLIQDIEKQLSDALNVPRELPRPIAASVSVLRDAYQHAGTDRHDYEPPRPRLRYCAHWLRVLNEGADFEVTDPRDKVYGVLGIITSPTTKLYVESRPDILSSEFPISYTKSVSEVYQDVVKHLINLDRNLDVLQVFEDRRNRAKDLPSWVTDWRQNKKRSIIQCAPDSQSVRNETGQAPIQDLKDIGRLELVGVQLGALTEVHIAREKIPWEELICPEPERMDSNYQEIRSSDGFVWGTFAASAAILEIRVLLPRVAKLDDILVTLLGSSTHFLLHPRSDGKYKFLGPVIAYRPYLRYWDRYPGKQTFIIV